MILVRRDAECQGDADEHDYKPYNNKLTQSMHNESGHIWTHLQTCWSQVLGPCCAPLGSFGPILGPYWDRLGPILGNLGLYWTHMGPYGRERAREREREREREIWVLVGPSLGPKRAPSGGPIRYHMCIYIYICIYLSIYIYIYRYTKHITHKDYVRLSIGVLTILIRSALKL